MSILFILLTSFLISNCVSEIIVDDFQHTGRYLDQENGISDSTGITGSFNIHKISNGVLSIKPNNNKAIWYSNLRCIATASLFTSIQLDIKSTKLDAPITLQLALGTSSTSCSSVNLYNVTVKTTLSMTTMTFPLNSFISDTTKPIQLIRLINPVSGITYTIDNIRFNDGPLIGPCSTYTNGCISMNSLPKYINDSGYYPIYLSAWSSIRREIRIDLVKNNNLILGSSKIIIEAKSTSAYSHLEIPFIYNNVTQNTDTGLVFNVYFTSPETPFNSINLISDTLNYATKYVACGPGKFALTYDDGPSNHTSALLDLLKTENIPATFFVCGNHTSFFDNSNIGTLIYPNIVKRMLQEGHLIGSHTWSHPTLTSLNDNSVRLEMRQLEDLLLTLNVPKPTFMRPPHSKTNTRVDKVLKEVGYSNIGINVDSWDWLLLNDIATSFSIYNDVLSETNSGFISIQHMVHPYVVDLTKKIIDLGRQKGYKFVKINECFN